MIGVKRFISTTLLGLALVAAPVELLAKDKVQVINAATTQTPANKLFSFSGDKAVSLAGVTKAAVGSFTVEFVTEQSMGVKKGNASQNTFYYLMGASPDDMQAIADAAYARFVTEATSAGIELVGIPATTGLPSYEQIRTTGKESGLGKDANGLKSIAYAPQGLPVAGLGLSALYSELAAGSTGIGALDTAQMFGRVTSDIGNGAQMGRSMGLMPALAQASGVPVINVRVTVSFATMEATSSGSFMGDSAGTKSNLRLNMSSLNTSMAVTDVAGKTRTVMLKSPLAVDAAFATRRQDISPTGQNVAVGLLGGLMGSKSSTRTSKYNIFVDPTSYGEGIALATGKSGLIMINALQGR
jgi:hypothetical protein